MSSPESAAATGSRAALWLPVGALFLAVAGNLGVWRKVSELLGVGRGGQLLTAVLALTLVLHVGLQLLCWRWSLRPVATLMLLLTAVSSYFVDAFGVRIDDVMMLNVLETDPGEVADLLSWPLAWRLTWCGLLPSALVWRVRWRFGRPLRELGLRGAVVLAHVALLVGAWGLFGAELKLFARENRPLRWMLSPSAPLAATFKLISRRLETPAGPLRTTAPDAVRLPRDEDAGRRVVVMVLGETATAGHFSLNGYDRETNPGLRQRDVINFSDVHACGTSTAESVPCVFSARGRSEFSREQADQEENLLDVLQRCGVQVLWRENNSGCKGVCDRVPFERAVTLTDDPALQSPDGVYDEALLTGLADAVAQRDGDVFIVLHQLGSHGPAYARRSPPEFKRFLPECDRPDVQNCTRAELVNAYDNTILYTDHVLSRLIDALEPVAADAQVVMLYVSDHGESLGEDGVFLHGYPYWLAPEEQTHIPMLMWFGPGSAEGLGLDERAVKAQADRALSHDHMFHTLLGLFGVQTALYDPALDLLDTARER